MIGLVHDGRLAVRALKRSPLLSTVIILSLALGIGANTAIFSLTDQLLLRRLPVRDPENLVMLYREGGSNVGNNTGPRTLALPLYLDLKRRAEPLAEVLCRREDSVSVSLGGQTERVEAEMVSGNYFTMLGVRPAAGRLFDAREDDLVPGGHQVVVLSHGYWLRRFGGDPGAVGSKILVNEHPMTVVGVSARSFTGLDPAHSPQIRVPILMTTADARLLEDRFTTWVQVFARLKAGQTVESARAQLQVLFSHIHAQEATLPGARDWSSAQRDAYRNETMAVEPAAVGYSGLREEFSRALSVLTAMVGLVLLIACANVANLLIAQGVARQKELAVRMAVGASRSRLVRQLFVESLVAAFAGGAAGVFLALTIVRGLLALVPAGWNLQLHPDPDFRVLLFTLALCVLTALAFGLVPALRATRPDLAGALKSSAGAIAPGGGSPRLRKALIAAQVALGFLLLFGAGLFARSLHALRSADSGLQDIHSLVTFQLDPGSSGYDDARGARLKRELLDRLRALPGVTAAGLACSPLLRNREFSAGLSVEGHRYEGGPDSLAFLNCFSPGYFETMGIHVLAGRDFELRDVRPGYPNLAIVNRAFARYHFGNRSAIGRHLGWGVGPNTPLNIEIVGVVVDAFHQGPREGMQRQVFFPDYGSRAATFYLRTATGAAPVEAAAREAVRQIDPSLPVTDLKTLAAQLDETLLTDRMIALLSAGFGLVALLLATIGVYGLMAFVVVRRTRELGVRIALGAPPRLVVWVVMKDALSLVAIGLGIGLPAALLLGRLVSSQLYGIPAGDPWVAAGAGALVTLTSVVASAIPARRAGRVSPILALRCE